MQSQSNYQQFISQKLRSSFKKIDMEMQMTKDSQNTLKGKEISWNTCTTNYNNLF